MVPEELLPGGRYKYVRTATAPIVLELLGWLVGLAPKLVLGGRLERVAYVAHYGHPIAVGPYLPLDNPDAYGHSCHIRNIDP